MKRLFAILMLLASPAVAADWTRYVDANNGSNSNDGSSGSPWQTVAYANSQMPTAGGGSYDNVILMLKDGQYGTIPKPPAAAANGKRYYFYGDVSDTGAVQVTASEAITWSNTSYAGMRFAGGITINGGAMFDTLRDFTSTGSLQISNAHYVIFLRGTFNGSGELNVCHTATAAAGVLCNGIKFLSMRFPNLGGPTVGGGVYFGQRDKPTDGRTGKNDSMTVEFSYIRMFINDRPGGTGTLASGVKIYNSPYMTLRYNRWEFYNYQVSTLVDDPSPAAACWTIRDSTTNYVQNGDTLYQRGPQGGTVYIPASGNYPASCNTYTIDSCLFVFGSSGSIKHQDRLTGMSFTRNVVASAKQRALEWISDISGTNTYNHNTFIGSAGNGVVAHPEGASEVSTGTGITTLTFTNNVVLQNKSESFDPNEARFAEYGSAYAIQWGEESWFDTKLTTNNNLYWLYDESSSNGSKTVGWLADDWEYASSSIDPGTTCDYDFDGFPNRPDYSVNWYKCQEGGETDGVIGRDSLSVYANPLLASAIFDGAEDIDTFDPTPSINSPVKGAGSSESDIGARSYVGTATPFISSGPLHINSVKFSQEITFVVANIGDGTLTFTASDNSSYFTIAPTSGTIASGSTQTFTVSYTTPWPTVAVVTAPTFTITTNSTIRPTVTKTTVFDSGGNVSQEE